MNSRRISLAVATVFTILSGTALPSHADRSCPLGFTAGSMGCQKVLKVKIENVCPDRRFRLDLRVGRDLCRKDNPVLGISQGDIINSVGDPRTKQKATEEITREAEQLTRAIGTGFTNSTPGKYPKIVTSERVLIDHVSMTKQDYTEITFDVIILPSAP
ncbi:hypothetical protein [Chamaesiphon sp. VAR_48_metabat_403]|uniref:hypothetical protein n=1 Tax=Chamaesiphon sp. VAR_48_metabat_403 TaxID=2964700 RepID=UPI00286DFC65|nr:hypothetical protein [Chamaesiphon sp. VAR_48_metabat_403]